jgi:hypothetical protein
MPRVGAFFTTRNLADGPLICALVLTVLVSVALLWANTATHAAIDERVVAAATRQNELTALVANLTTDVDAVVEELMTLQQQRNGLEKRRAAVALGAGELELQKVQGLRDRTRKELRRIHDVIDSSKKELMEFINKK